MRKYSISLLVAALAMILTLIPWRESSAQTYLPIDAKGIYIWQIWTSHGGGKNLNTIISKLKSVGISWIVIKMGDGDSYYNRPSKSLYNWATTNYGGMDSVIAIFHANGIKLFAFQYVYGIPNNWGNSVTETDVANSILSIPEIDGLLIDAEQEYDVLSNRDAAAAAYCDNIRNTNPFSFIGLTAWSRIVGHSTFPWVAFLERVDVNMPQAYWAARPTSVANELNLMNSQFASYTSTWINQGHLAAAKPIMPIGQGEYFGYGADVATGDIKSFCDLSKNTYNYAGVSLWEYNQISKASVWSEYTAAWQPTSVLDEKNIPSEYVLHQNYPNPFNPVTTIGYTISGNLSGKSENVLIRVFDVLGNEVATLVNEPKAPGYYEVQFDGSKYSSGVYLYRIISGNYVSTKKFVLMK